jgi:undecaprenyl-diphosphatase
MVWLVFAALGDGARPGLALLLIGGAATVAASRMVLQVHYPSDVAAGFLVAVAWSALAVLIAQYKGLV